MNLKHNCCQVDKIYKRNELHQNRKKRWFVQGVGSWIQVQTRAEATFFKRKKLRKYARPTPSSAWNGFHDTEQILMQKYRILCIVSALVKFYFADEKMTKK